MCPFPSGCLPLQSLPFSKNINMLFFSQFAIPCTICHVDLWHFGSVRAQKECHIKAAASAKKLP